MIPFSVNNILGFPHETYELALDTVRFNRHVDSDDAGMVPPEALGSGIDLVQFSNCETISSPSGYGFGMLGYI